MRPFKHINAHSLEEAAAALGEQGATLIAGGTDLMGAWKDNILPQYPTTVVNIKTIDGLDYIREEDGALRIGALTRLADIAESPLVQEKYAALAQAAHAVATPHIREMGTIAGNIAQMPRCWYFRKAEDRFDCIRKGGKECYAIRGQNKFHSIFGGKRLQASPCTQECPAGTDIPAYMEQLRAGNWDEAARIIMRVNPMPAITSRVCAHFCQQGCNRCASDESVLVGGVERTLGDYILDHPEKFYTAPEKETGKSVAIVGSGPSGLAAAFYLRRAGNKVTVYDSKEEAGGVLMYAIPAYRLPRDVVRRFIAALRGMGVEFKTNTQIGKDVLPETLEKEYDSVCYATGAWKRPFVGIDGEELTVFGLDFLVEVDAWMRNKIGSEVFVTGGGNVAMDVAITAKRLGAKKVTMACLEPRDRMPASKEEIARAEEEGIVIMPGWGPARVVEENGVVKGMELKRCTSPWNESGAFDPQYDENETTFVPAQNILMAVGQRVDLSFLDEKYQVQLTRRGLIDVTEDTAMTSRPGIFAGGDATTGPATVIRAIAEGHKAANGMNKYLGTEPPTVEAKLSRWVSFDGQGVMNTTPIKLRELAVDERSINREDSATPTQEEALAETRRCMDCACYAVHPSDVAPALVVLGAEVITNRRTLGIEELFDATFVGNTVLAPDEIITEIRVPAPKAGSKSAFKKFAYRKSIDFPVVNCAVVIGDEPRVCFNAVAPSPYRARGAEDVLAKAGKIDEESAAAAGEAAMAGAVPAEDNRYKIQICKTILKRMLLELAN